MIRKYFLPSLLLSIATKVFFAVEPSENKTFWVVLVAKESDAIIPYEDDQQQTVIKEAVHRVLPVQGIADLTTEYAHEEDQFSHHGTLTGRCARLMRTTPENFVQRSNRESYGSAHRFFHESMIKLDCDSNEKNLRKQAATITGINPTQLQLSILAESHAFSATDYLHYGNSTIDHQFFPGPHTTRTLYTIFKQHKY